MDTKKVKLTGDGDLDGDSEDDSDGNDNESSSGIYHYHLFYHRLNNQIRSPLDQIRNIEYYYI